MRLAIVTGADHGYFDLMMGLIQTLTRSEVARDYQLCVLDFGLLPEQIAMAEDHGARLVRPGWEFRAPDELKVSRNLGYATRPRIPDYFPGYDMYLWMDADVSVQDGSFVSSFIASASDGAIAIAEEADPSYRVELYALKWQVGNAIRCFGLRHGLQLCRGRPINSGVFALRADAPLWQIWQRRYQQAVDRAARVNLDQHALMAALYLDDMPCRYLDSTHNWICTRSQPVWDEDQQVFRRPDAPYQPIKVLHLAGQQKSGLWDIKTLAGGMKRMPLSYTIRHECLLDGEPTHA